MKLSFPETCFLVGFFGDLGLQLFGKINKRWGLDTYFARHYRLESMFIAGGLLTLTGDIYQRIDPSLNIIGLAIYGTILDILFRMLMIFPSLGDYYVKLNPFYTIIWAIMPFMISLVIYRIFGSN